MMRGYVSIIVNNSINKEEGMKEREFTYLHTFHNRAKAPVHIRFHPLQQPRTVFAIVPPCIPLIVSLFLSLVLVIVVEESRLADLVGRMVGEERVEEGASEIVETLEVAGGGVLYGPNEQHSC